ncbi:hypothetical protein DNTS_008193 [Danionella cerebrum]|uniref:Extracellular matrix protein 1 n=1 Tax=Danionella cerebrum TaxID=2873325 RepID=A0A553R5I3_9TELE|nr:hypothetical protein DNTS_008193 [Danionella translucida]
MKMMMSPGAVGLFSLLLALSCEASEDSPTLLQRDVTDKLLDDEPLEKELSPEEREFVMLQRPVWPDLTKVIALGSSEASHGEATNFHPENTPRGPPMFGPRFLGPSVGPEVHFPPAFPNAANLQAICEFSEAPVRYPKEMFPRSGFSNQFRKGEAVNKLQSWYGVCCRLNGTQEEQVCCAEQAWKKSLSAYCFREFTIKTVAYFCCNNKGKARWSCFDKEAPESSYDVLPDLLEGQSRKKSRGFKFNSQACKV